jgi:hypothetical protein
MPASWTGAWCHPGLLTALSSGLGVQEQLTSLLVPGGRQPLKEVATLSEGVEAQ